MNRLLRLAVPLLVVAWTVGGPSATAAKDRLPRIKRSAEFRFVDAADEEAVAKALPALLKEYDTPKKCEKSFEGIVEPDAAVILEEARRYTTHRRPPWPAT